MSKHLAHAPFLILLLFLKAVRFAGHGIHLLGGFSLLHPAQQVGSFLQAFRGTPRSGIIWLALRSCAGHIFLGLTQAIERLLHAVISQSLGTGRAIGALLAAGALLPTAAAASALPLLTLLPALLATLLLATLLLAALLPALLIRLLITLLLLLVALHLFHLALQLFGFAAQHLFLPALLVALIAVALLLGQFFLALSQLLQLLQGFIDFLGALVCGITGLTRFVLVLLGIQFQVEETGEIASCRAATPTAASSRSEGHLNLTEGGFGAKQVLQRLLFVG
jgi:hypothetical protein